MLAKAPEPAKVFMVVYLGFALALIAAAVRDGGEKGDARAGTE
jgi:hypothetical protein